MTLENRNIYVVTRNNRRIEENNYSDKSDADFRAEQLRSALKIYDPKDAKNIAVIKTKKPNQIR